MRDPHWPLLPRELYCKQCGDVLGLDVEHTCSQDFKNVSPGETDVVEWEPGEFDDLEEV